MQSYWPNWWVCEWWLQGWNIIIDGKCKSGTVLCHGTVLWHKPSNMIIVLYCPNKRHIITSTNSHNQAFCFIFLSVCLTFNNLIEKWIKLFWFNQSISEYKFNMMVSELPYMPRFESWFHESRNCPCYVWYCYTIMLYLEIFMLCEKVNALFCMILSFQNN